MVRLNSASIRCLMYIAVDISLKAVGLVAGAFIGTFARQNQPYPHWYRLYCRLH